MSIEWVLYLIDIFGSLKILFLFLTIILVFFVVISGGFLINLYQEYDKDDEDDIKIICLTKRILLGFLFILIILVVSFTLIPSEKTMYAMALSRYSKQSEIPSKVLKAIESKLDDIINESRN